MISSFFRISFHISVWLPVLFYFFVWNYAKKFQSLIGGADPVETFASIGAVLRALTWIFAAPNAVYSLTTYAPYVYVLAFSFVVFGQVVNAQVYQKLGKVGVYYGSRFGRKTPWITGWPYNFLSHPQYISSFVALIVIEDRKPLTA